MLLRSGPHRTSRLDRRLGYSLAFIAGALNSAGFYSLGFFASNMTGNFSAGADELAVGDLLQGLVYLLLPVSFILGAACATLWTEFGLKRGIRRIYALSILLEALLLLVLGMLELWAGAHGRAMVLGLSALMGFQNAVATRISSGRVRTTHVSGMSTDIGIGIGMLASMRLHRDAAVDQDLHLDPLKLHGLTVLSFCSGGIIGVLAYKEIGALLLFIAAALLAALALPSLTKRGVTHEIGH